MIPGVSDERHLGRAAFLGVTSQGCRRCCGAVSAWETASGLLPTGIDQVLPQPTSGWRIYTVAASMPRIDPGDVPAARRRAVERPVSLHADRSAGPPVAEQVSDFHCVTGWTVEDVRWTGVRIRDVLARASPLPVGRALSFVSAERPYVDSLTLDQACFPDAMLAWEMDDWPLPRPHGGAAAARDAGMYGYKSVKWVDAHRGRPGSRSSGTGSTAGLRPRRVGRPLRTPRDAGLRSVRRLLAHGAALHWVHAVGVLRAARVGARALPPSLAAEVGRRPLVKDVHLLDRGRVGPRPAGVARPRRPAGPARHGARARRFDADDRRWLLGRRTRRRGGSTPGRSSTRR